MRKSISIKTDLFLKRTLLLIGLIIITNFANSQSIKLKKGYVLLDGKEILKYERENSGVYQIHFFDLKDDNEVLFIKKNNNETIHDVEDDYTEIKFIELRKGLEIKQNRTWAGYLEWLIKNKVLNYDGTINEDKAEALIENYDENISNRTIRVR